MGKNKTVKYLKYAIGVILLLVIGNLINLQMHNWNDTRKQALEDAKILQSTKTESQSDAVDEAMKKMEDGRQQKLDVIQKFYGVFENGDMSVLEDILAPNYTQIPSDPGQTPDIEGFIKHAQMFGSMFSNLKGTQTHILVDKDFVQVRSELEVTHTGDAFGIPKTDKRIKLVAFDLHHFNKDGKIDKTWHLEDFWGVYSQINSK